LHRGAIAVAAAAVVLSAAGCGGGASRPPLRLSAAEVEANLESAAFTVSRSERDFEQIAPDGSLLDLNGQVSVDALPSGAPILLTRVFLISDPQDRRAYVSGLPKGRPVVVRGDRVYTSGTLGQAGLDEIVEAGEGE
jgi:hypothetical protein